MGRFNQPDTIIPDPNLAQSWDRYSYTSNNPIKYIDPSGHDDIPASTWQEIRADINQIKNNYTSNSLLGEVGGGLVGLAGPGPWAILTVPLGAVVGHLIEDAATKTNTDLSSVNDLMDLVWTHNNQDDDNIVNGCSDYYFKTEMTEVYDASGNLVQTVEGSTTLYVQVDGKWISQEIGKDAKDIIFDEFKEHDVKPTTKLEYKESRPHGDN